MVFRGGNGSVPLHIPYLPRNKIDFTREVQGLLDASEEDLKGLAAEKEEIPLENTDTITNL